MKTEVPKQGSPTAGPHHVVIAPEGNFVKTEDKQIVCLCTRLEDAILHSAASALVEASTSLLATLRKDGFRMTASEIILNNAIVKASGR